MASSNTALYQGAQSAGTEFCTFMHCSVFLPSGQLQGMAAGEGMTDLYEVLQPVLDDLEESDVEEEPVGEERQRAVQLAIMGLPNVVSSCPLYSQRLIRMADIVQEDCM